jgi:hypothetical protein
METPGSEQERQRLTKLYAGLSDGELQEFADDAASLTEMAREALKAELDRRGLDIKLGGPRAVDSVEQRKLVTIRKFRDLPDALLAKGRLDSVGIESFITDDNMVRMDWFISNLLGGIKLRVNPEDAEVATELLDQPIPETFDVEGVGEYQQPRCPECKSMDIIFEHLNKPILYTSAYFLAPLPVRRNLWKCESCGHTWQGSSDSPGKAQV